MDINQLMEAAIGSEAASVEIWRVYKGGFRAARIHSSGERIGTPINWPVAETVPSVLLALSQGRKYGEQL